MTIYDVEYNANPYHEDLEVPLQGGNSNLVVEEGDIIDDPFDDPGHGTAVFSEMLATKDNGFGIVGISHGAKGKLAPEKTVKGGSNRANAIVLATKDAEPGDVILLEMQTDVCGYDGFGSAFNGFGPAEWDLTVRDATEIAVANGIVVVISMHQAVEGVLIERSMTQEPFSSALVSTYLRAHAQTSS